MSVPVTGTNLSHLAGSAAIQAAQFFGVPVGQIATDAIEATAHTSTIDSGGRTHVVLWEATVGCWVKDEADR